MKTNAMRLLDKAKIPYEELDYSIAKEDFNGEAVADLLGMDHKACYKTLAAKNGHDLYILVLSVDDELDLKKCAKALSVKSLEMLHVKDLLKEVGYERGSVSPVGCKKNKGIVFDDEVMNFQKIEISGGAYGVGIKVDRKQLIDFLGADVKDIVMD